MLRSAVRAPKRPAVRRAAAAAGLVFLSLALYFTLLWPVPAHFSRGIPFGAFATDAEPRALQPGDHLQLLYHFDLARQWLAGEVPFFSDPWEFNAAGSPARRAPPPAYATFSVPYAALVSLGVPDAAAWNFLQFLSVAAGVFFCFALARRFGASPAAACGAAALASCVPYRWTMLGQGSPTGFGMCFVPGVALGIDLAVRDRRARGGVLAGAMLAACWATDLHCFLFAGLALPVWGFAALVRSPDAPFAARRRVVALLRAVAPAAVAAAAVAAAALAAGGSYEGTDVSGGRSLGEIHLHSPRWGALLDPFFDCHAAKRFYVGWPLLAAFALSALACLAVADRASIAAARDRPDADGAPRYRAIPRPFFGGTSGAQQAAAGLVLAAAAVLAAFLALGENGPFDALPLRFLRAAVPPFRMVRQPIKVFCLLPSLLAPLFATGFSALARSRTAPRFAARAAAVLLPALFAAAVFGEGGRMHAGVCILPGRNTAWDAAAADAAARGVPPRALVLPIHDADQASGSVCQYLAIRSRLPVLNGYSAVDDVAYTRDVVRRFDGLSGGGLAPSQADGLRECGVSHLILSETAFGADGAPFPFASALRRFLDAPSFRLVASDAGWWAFAFDPDAAVPSAPPPARLPIVEYPAPERTYWKFRPAAPAAKVQADVPEAACGGGFGWIVLGDGRGAIDAVSTVADADGCEVSETTAMPAPPRESKKKTPGLAFAPSPAPPDGAIVKSGLETSGFGRVAYAAWTASGGVVSSAPGAPEGTFRLDPGLFHHTAGTISSVRPDGTPSGLSFRKWRDSPSFEAAVGPSLPLGLPAGQYDYRLVFADGDDAGALPEGSDPGVAVRSASGFSRFSSRGPCAGTLAYDGLSPVRFALYWSGARDRDLVAIEIRPAPSR